MSLAPGLGPGWGMSARVLRPIGCVGEKSLPGEEISPTLPEDAQFHKENITSWRQAFPAPLRGLTFYLISTPGQGPGLKSYHPSGVTHIPAQKLYTRINILWVRMGTDAYG